VQSWEIAREKLIRATRDQAASGHPIDRFFALEAAGEPPYQFRVRLAAVHCRWCARCGRDLKPGEPVWLHFAETLEAGEVSVRPLGRFAPHCEACRRSGLTLDLWPGTRGYLDLGPCEGCGRTVHRALTRRPQTVACCDECRKVIRRRRARQRRLDRRIVDTGRCSWCGDPFTPARRDARYCSGRCRVAAHRAGRKP
jgi:hypothetical protein